jgi:hypothetical protein
VITKDSLLQLQMQSTNMPHIYSNVSEPNTICAAQSGNSLRHLHLLFSFINERLMFDTKRLHRGKRPFWSSVTEIEAGLWDRH